MYLIYPNHDEKWDEMPDAIFYFWITKKSHKTGRENYSRYKMMKSWEKKIKHEKNLVIIQYIMYLSSLSDDPIKSKKYLNEISQSDLFIFHVDFSAIFQIFFNAFKR